MNNFGYMAAYKDYVEKIQTRKLVLFGAGDNAAYIISRYYHYDEIYAIWDNNSAKWGGKHSGLGGIPVSKPELTDVKPVEVVVLITVSDELAISEIQEQLNGMGITYVYPGAILELMNEIERYNADFTRKFHELNTYGLIERSRDKIEQVRGLLADEKSIVVYDAIVDKTKYNLDDYTDVADDLYEHYFSDGIFHYSDSEVLVDGGAFLGEDTIRLARLIGKDKIKRSYCFEPDIANYQRCIKNLLKFFNENNGEDLPDCYKGEHFVVFKSGLLDVNSNVGFISYGTHNSVFAYLRNASASESIPAVRLDDAIDPNSKITLIKMDIEGAEIPALRGAEQIIKRDKPKLAICIYHMIEDLWTIPLYIHSLVPEYKLYVRHHTTKFWDSVLYTTI
jgi:FkbM family methyltransferase